MFTIYHHAFHFISDFLVSSYIYESHIYFDIVSLPPRRLMLATPIYRLRLSFTFPRLIIRHFYLRLLLLRCFCYFLIVSFHIPRLQFAFMIEISAHLLFIVFSLHCGFLHLLIYTPNNSHFVRDFSICLPYLNAQHFTP